MATGTVNDHGVPLPDTPEDPAREVESGPGAPPPDPQLASAIEIVEFGPRLRVGRFARVDSDYTLVNLVETVASDGPPSNDPTAAWSDVQSRLVGENALYQDQPATPLALTGTRLAPPRPAIFIGDVPPIERSQLVGAMRGQGFITRTQIRMAAKDFVERSDPNSVAEKIRTAKAELVVLAFIGPRSGAALTLGAQIVRHLVPACSSGGHVLALLGSESSAAIQSALAERGDCVQLNPDAGRPEGLKALHEALAAAYARLISPIRPALVPDVLSGCPAIPVTVALRRSAWRLASAMGLRVAIAHVEPTGIILAWASPESIRIASFGYVADGRDGMPFGLALDPAEIARWLPAPLSDESVTSSLLARGLRPWTIVVDRQDRLIADAAAAAGLDRACRQLGLERFECDLAIASGSTLGSDCSPAAAAAALLNGLQPVHFCQLAQDSASTLAMLGAIDLAGEPVDHSVGLIPLGLSVAVSGRVRDGDPGLRMLIERPDGRRLDRVVPFGAIERMATVTTDPLTVRAIPAPGLDLGRGSGQAVKLETAIAPSPAGILVDVRGRPLETASDSSAQADQVLQWLQGLDTFYPPETPPGASR